MILTVFRSRLRPGVEAQYRPLAAEMSELAQQMEGFVDETFFAAPNGDRVTIVRFVDRSSHDAWARHPRHRDAQRRGRDEFYESYEISITEVLDERRFTFDQSPR
ncbi:MAG TPA: antibiotic biosynthesis monooxygenase [Acidimicrobiales bacterium]|nr:antibiotic biosynthesis monooxygenase [Acidimicrobiales bacterium]